MRKQATVAAVLVAGLAVATPAALLTAQPALASEEQGGGLTLSDVAIVADAPIDSDSAGAKGTESDPWDVSADNESNVFACLQNNPGTDTYTLVFKGQGKIRDYTGKDDNSKYWKSNYDKITEVTVGEGITDIGTYALSHLSALNKISLPETVVSIKDSAFGASGSASIGVFEIGTNVSHIEDGAFRYAKFSSFEVDSNNEYFKASDEGLLYSADGKELIAYPCGKTSGSTGCFNNDWLSGVETIRGGAFWGASLSGSVVVPESVKSIGDYAFSQVIKASDGAVNTLILPDSLINLGNHAFDTCKFSGELKLGKSLKSIGNDAFNHAGFSSLDFGESEVAEIGARALFDNALEVLTIPASVKTIGEHAFSTCKSCHALNLTESGVTSYGTSAFSSHAQGAIAYVRDGAQKNQVASLVSNISGDSTFAITNGGIFADDTTFVAGQLSTPDKAGYTFAGWYTKDGSNGAWGDKADSPVAGKTYYAKWKLNKPTVSIEVSGNGWVIGAKPVTLKASVNHELVDGVTYNYEWLKNGKTLQTATTDTLSVGSGGSYTCRVTATKGDLTSEVASQSVEVSAAVAEGSIEPEKSSVSIMLGNPAQTMKVKVTEGIDGDALKVASSDANVATARYENGTLAIEPVNVGTARITLSFAGYAWVSAASATVDVTVYRYVPSSTTTTETVTNPDGSVTTTEADKSTGTVTVTNKSADGVETKTVTAKDAEPRVSVTVPASVKSATVTVPVEPSEGTVVVDAKTGRVVNRCVATEDGLDVRVDGSCELVVRENAKTFGDMSGHWSAKAVDFASARGLMNGIGDTGTFEPETMTSRAMVCAVLSNLEYGPEATKGLTFSDTDANGWYADAVAWAFEAGIVHGYGDGRTFGPGDDVTREQMACMIYNYAKAMGMDTSKRADLSAFGDASELTFGREAMEWCVASGIFHGYDGGEELGATDGLTRAQCAAVLMNLVTLIVEG